MEDTYYTNMRLKYFGSKSTHVFNTLYSQIHACAGFKKVCKYVYLEKEVIATNLTMVTEAL